MELNTLLILALLVFYVLPLSLGIWFLSWVIKIYKSEKLALTVKKILFTFLGLAFLGVVIYDYAVSRHRMRFELDERYELQVFMHERESFLDWPIDVEVIILDRENEEKLEVEFNSDGPYYQFLIHPEGKIWMKGYDKSQWIDWTFDFEKHKVYEDSPRKEEGFIFHKQINMYFEIEEDLAPKKP